jgi:SAM-dependent methyltransferase
MLAKRGAAYVLGLDSCEPMIEAANALRTEVDEYRVADVQNLDFIEVSSFELAVSYLNQCDLPDFESNTREVFRILKPGSRFVVANLHPMRTGAGGWHKDETGQKLHAILDNYFDESERTWEIWEKPLTNFHRTLSTYLDGFKDAGFGLVRIIEPRVSPENVEKFPELVDELRVPNFIIYVLNKPTLKAKGVKIIG